MSDKPVSASPDLLPASPTPQRPRTIAVIAAASLLVLVLLWLGLRTPPTPTTEDKTSAQPRPSSVPSTLNSAPIQLEPLYPASAQAEALRMEREAAIAASLGIQPDALDSYPSDYPAPPDPWGERNAPWNQPRPPREDPAPPLPTELTSEQRAQRAPLVVRASPPSTAATGRFNSRPATNTLADTDFDDDTFNPAAFAQQALGAITQAQAPTQEPKTPNHLVFPAARAITPERAPNANRIRAGAVISAVLLTPINTTLEQTIKAQVTRDLWDERLRRVVVPRGSFLIGLTSTEVSSTQKRALSAWHQIQLPDGRTFNLSADPGADQLGTVGIPGKLRRHFWSSLGNASLLAILSAGAQLSQPRRDSTAINAIPTTNQTLAASLGTQISQFATEILRRDLSRAPLLTVPAPLPFTVLVTADTTIHGTH